MALISSSNQTTKTFNLVEDATETLTNRTVLYGILIAFVASFILMMGVLWWNRIYLQVLWKRKFGTYSEGALSVLIKQKWQAIKIIFSGNAFVAEAGSPRFKPLAIEIGYSVPTARRR